MEGYFYNPNIHPYTEFLKRQMTLEQYAGMILLPLTVDNGYDLETFLKGAIEYGADRCLFCYRTRLEKVFRHAVKTGFKAVSTTLLYSKYQRHDDIRRIGEELSETYDILFVYRDFRKGWKKGIEKSKAVNMYRQNYCGCIFSEKERYQPR